MQALGELLEKKQPQFHLAFTPVIKFWLKWDDSKVEPQLRLVLTPVIKFLILMGRLESRTSIPPGFDTGDGSFWFWWDDSKVEPQFRLALTPAMEVSDFKGTTWQSNLNSAWLWYRRFQFCLRLLLSRPSIFFLRVAVQMRLMILYFMIECGLSQMLFPIRGNQ